MKDFLLIDKKEIQLNSGLDEIKFGKTKFASVVSQKGVFYDGENFQEWTFGEVKAQEIESRNEPVVFFSGANPFKSEAKSLLDYYETNDRSKVFAAAYAVCNALTVAAKNGTSIPMTGAGGILVEEKDENPSILFLPAELIKNACAGMDTKDKANLYGCWLNESIFDLPALCFFRSVVAYTMLTGAFPFASSDILERNADILDQKFLPLELRLPTVSPKLAAAVNKSLKLTSSAVTEPGKKQKGTSSEQLHADPDFPLDLLLAEKDNAPTPAQLKEYAEKAEATVKQRDSKIKAKRLIRRNTAAILTCIGAVIALFFIVRSAVKSHEDEYTTQSLTSVESLVAFYKNVNEKDVSMIGNFTKGRSATKFTDSISQVYVMSKQRQQYGGDNGFAKPENFFLYITDAYKLKSTGMFGITNIKIDGEPYELAIDIPKFKDKLPALKEENGMELTKGLQIKHKVEYFQIHTEGENCDILVTYNTADVTLTYNGGRWVITSISVFDEPFEFDSTEFKLEYFDMLDKNEGDVIKTVEMMSFKYPWVPTAASIEREQERLYQIAQELFPEL